MFLLDTNVVSELRKSKTAHPNVSAWAASTALDRTHVSVVTLLEVKRGILQAARRDPHQSIVLYKWLQQSLIEQFAGRILNVDMAVAFRSAELHIPDPKPELDAIIAATALIHNLTVVTRNIKDFAAIGVKLFDPWQPAS